MVRDIFLFGNKVLRQVCEEVEKLDFDIRNLVIDLKDTLNHFKGYGLSAPQIGILKRVFVIKREVGGNLTGEIIVMINPVFEDKNGGYQRGEEGCLSFPGFTRQITRPKLVSVYWMNEEGLFKREAFVGNEARAICHENDHLNGKLIIDGVSEGKRKRAFRRYKKFFDSVLHPKIEREIENEIHST